MNTITIMVSSYKINNRYWIKERFFKAKEKMALQGENLLQNPKITTKKLFEILLIVLQKHFTT